MKRKFFKGLWILLICLSGTHNLFSQGINNLWLLGYSGGGGGINFEFSSGSLVIDSFSRKMSFGATDASICDKNGNILFYTNGLWVANALHDTMLNGSDLNPGPFSAVYAPYGLPFPQAALILPVPGDSIKYYLFHETRTNTSIIYPTELNYSAIDMMLDNGKGEVIFKNVLLLTDTMAGYEITATRHANGRDWWLIQHKHASDLFYTFLISPSGVSIPIHSYTGLATITGIQASFSPKGDKFVRYNTLDDLEVYDFDRCSGVISNPLQIAINDSMIGGGVAFSPSGRYVYASSVKYVYQFDLQAANIAASMQTVAVWDGYESPPGSGLSSTFYLMQLAPDGKIYISCQNSTVDMHVINYPDSAGLACDLQQHSVHLPAYNAFSVPNHPNYFLGALTGSPCDSLTPVLEITNNTIPIRINPNPAQNTFYLNYELPYGKTAVATIYNTIGEAVMLKNLYWYFGYFQIDCSELSNGVYFVKVEGQGVSGNAKVVVTR